MISSDYSSVCEFPTLFSIWIPLIIASYWTVINSSYSKTSSIFGWVWFSMLGSALRTINRLTQLRSFHIVLSRIKSLYWLKKTVTSKAYGLPCDWLELITGTLRIIIISTVCVVTRPGPMPHPFDLTLSKKAALHIRHLCCCYHQNNPPSVHQLHYWFAGSIIWFMTKSKIKIEVS